MMDNKMLGDVLPFCEADPALSSRMFIYKRCEVIDFILDDPQMWGIWLPQFLVSLLLFFHPYFGGSLESSAGEGLALFGCREYLELHPYQQLLSDLNNLLLALTCVCYYIKLLTNSNRMKVKINSWHAVATWKWDIESADSCAICQFAFESPCPRCKVPGDGCIPL